MNNYTISADDFIKIISTGNPVLITETTIQGNVDLNSILIASEINIDRCKFDGTLNFSYADFEASLDIPIM